MNMHRRHFQLIADLLNTAVRPKVTELDYSKIVFAASVRLAETNPQFDQAKFEQACGLANEPWERENGRP